jgi:hypothetical protein
VVIVLSTGPKVREFKSGRGRRVFKGYKIRSTPSFAKQGKPAATCKILRYLKDPYTIKEILVDKIQTSG